MNRESALDILVVGCCGVGKTGGPVHFNLRDNIERGDTHMLKNDPVIDGVIFMYDVNRSGSFTWLLMRYKEYLSDKHAIITFVGNKAEDAWLSTRQISLRYAQEIAHHWDTGSYHINTRCKTDLLSPLLYLARKIIKVDELALLKPPPTAPQLPLPPPPPPPPSTYLLPPPPPHYSAPATTNTTSSLIFLAERIREAESRTENTSLLDGF